MTRASKVIGNLNSVDSMMVDTGQVNELLLKIEAYKKELRDLTYILERSNIEKDALIDSLQHENISLRFKVEELSKLSIHNSPVISKPTNQYTIPKDIKRKLLQLIHPDKDNNSEIANKSTKWLLSLQESE